MEKNKKIYLTKEGLKDIKKEYQKLLRLKKIKSEQETPLFLESDEVNTEFLSYQEDFEYLESRIEDLEYALKNFELIKIPSKQERNKVHLGATVKIDLDNEIDEFTIVGALETNPARKKISDQSPLGKALIGQRVGDKITVKTNFINHNCRILKIEYKQ